MRRILLEWCGLFFTGIAAALLVYWCISLLSNHSLFLVLGESVQIQMAADDGQITFARWLDNIELIQNASKKGSLNMVLPVTNNFGWNVPGFDFRHLTFSDGSTEWYLRLSLLIPFLIFGLLGGICLYRFRARPT